jgi:hypothetical protein
MRLENEYVIKNFPAITISRRHLRLPERGNKYVGMLINFHLYREILILHSIQIMYTRCPRMHQHNFNHKLLGSCRTRKKYLKNI